MTTFLPAETLTIEGADAVAFAQSQFSSNLAALANGRWQFSAWLDARGRVRALFHLVRLGDERLLLLLRGGTASTMVEALRRFVFRSRVTLECPPPGALGTGDALPLHATARDGDRLLLGCGDHSLLLGDGIIPDDAWQLPQLHQGWAWLPGNAVDTLLPPALSLYRLSAVALDKGCYPGQEIVARLHYRGGHKRHLHRIVMSGPMPAGSMFHLDGREAGPLLQTIPRGPGIEALAVVPDEVAERFREGTQVAVDEGPHLRVETRWND
jgi:folate-binding protein YgfZ